MSLALARKYRPSTFDDLIGQDAVSQTLSLALDGDRLSHAYLFSGLRGSGKTSTARIFAKALLCEKGATSHPCNTCDHCIMANESRHMDIIEMDAASNRGIDDIKELIEHTKYKPSIGRFKIFIIDEVHMLTTQAFNALLKTLEEPPDFVKFILATTDPLKLPATILSRTQHFRFKKIPQKLVLSHLEEILNLEEISYEKEALDIIARSGAGSLRDSLTLMDQAIVYSKNHVDIATVTGMLGIIEPSLLDDLLSAILAKDNEKILAFIRTAADFEAEMIVDELTLHLKGLLFEKDNRFSPLIIDRFFRILADTKDLLSLGSDGEFSLSLALFKMVESLSVHDIDDMIRSLQKELSPISASTTPSAHAPIKEEKSEPTATASPEAATAPTVTEKKTGPIASPAPEAPAAKEESANPEPQSAPKEATLETTAAPQSEPAPAAPSENYGQMFQQLQKKIYDRDYDLGNCFERNITFESFDSGELTWHSSAKSEDKKMLISHWSIIRMFVQELFGLETKIVNIPTEPKPEPEEAKKKTDDQPAVTPKAEEASQPGSTIEDVELGSGSCVTPDTCETEASKEKDPSKLLEEPMIKEMIALFDPKKVRVIKK